MRLKILITCLIASTSLSAKVCIKHCSNGTSTSTSDLTYTIGWSVPDDSPCTRDADTPTYQVTVITDKKSGNKQIVDREWTIAAYANC